MKHDIMFVENPISVLESLQWIFKDDPYHLFTYNTPYDALSVINRAKWDVVPAERNINHMEIINNFVFPAIMCNYLYFP